MAQNQQEKTFVISQRLDSDRYENTVLPKMHTDLKMRGASRQNGRRLDN